MEPLSRYYLKDGAFHLKSKWPRRIRICISTLFFALSALFVNQEAFTHPPTFAQIRQEQISKVVAIGNVPKKEADQIVKAVYKWAREFDVDKNLVLAIIKVESQFNKHAISKSGAYGLMQIIPVWHKDKIIAARAKLGNPELFDINTNVFLGTWVLKDCLTKYKGNVSNALQCYSGQTPGYDQKVLVAYKDIKILS